MYDYYFSRAVYSQERGMMARVRYLVSKVLCSNQITLEIYGTYENSSDEKLPLKLESIPRPLWTPTDMKGEGEGKSQNMHSYKEPVH